MCVFPGANRTFGVSIDELLKRSEGCEIPPIITSIVEYLKEHGNVVNVYSFFSGGAEGGNHDITVFYIHTCICTQ